MYVSLTAAVVSTKPVVLYKEYSLALSAFFIFRDMPECQVDNGTQKLLAVGRDVFLHVMSNDVSKVTQ